MATAHSWHPGQAALTPRWTFPVDLLPDESISSYIVRAAIAHGCGPSALASWLWPDWRAWATDIDRGLSDDRLRALTRSAGIDAECFRRAATAQIATQIEGKVPDANKGWRWILARSAATGKRTAQFCPACLADDDRPHYRVQWRFAWHTACAKHQTMLLDGCAQCGAAIRPHRLNETARHAAQCARCRADYRRFPTPPCDPAALRFQNAADQVLSSGSGPCFGQSVAVDVWFHAAHFFANLLRRSASQRTRATDAFLAQFQIEAPVSAPVAPGARIERLPVAARHRIAGAVWRIMNVSADQFRRAVEDSGISQQGWCGRRETVPTPIADVLPNLPHRGRAQYVRKKRTRRGPRCRSEVMRMMSRLERTLRSDSP